MQRGSNPGQSAKPEYVLKRANDQINSAVGNNADKEKKLALALLHGAIGAKKKGVLWTKSHEQLMKRHLELCVDLKDHRMAKDGLHQYRNLCQSVDPNSLETVIIHLMELSEARATAARQKADRVALAAAAKVNDLDQEETPESIMLSSMTAEGGKDRTDREVVVPWLKFLWENYRAILELLHKNAKLERIYHKTAEKAFKFCLDYQRNLEFRRLCEMLRQQFTNLQRMTAQPRNSARIAWEWTPESIELHLHTRFVQLEVATTLELWNEGFQTVEDIYEIMILGKQTPKKRLMASYYEKLTKIFWVADNQLFHAYAWFRHYSLSCEYRKDIKAEEKSMMATSVLLSALSIPSLRDNTDPAALLEEDEIASDKSQQMAKLLDFQANPTRKALLEDIVAKGVLADVVPEIAALYNLLETKFNPLGLVSALKPIITAIKSHPQLAMYALPLERVAVVRVMQQLSRVYSALKMDFLQRLLSGLEDISYNQIEKIMIDGVSRKQLQVRIDHRNGCLRFGSSGSATSGTIEGQVAQLGSSLNKVAHNLSITLGSNAHEEAAVASRKQYFKKVIDAVEYEHESAVERKKMIEKRKEGLERIQQDRQKDEQRTKEIEEERRQKMDAMRLDQEQRVREDEKRRKLIARQDLLRIQKELERYNVIMSEEALTEMTPAARQGLLTDAKSEAMKAKEDEGRRVNEQAKRLDHITRALRIEAPEAIAKKYAEQVAEDRAAHKAKIAEKQEEGLKQHMVHLQEKVRLSRMLPVRSVMEAGLLVQQKRMYDDRVAEMMSRALEDHRWHKLAKARHMLDEDNERRQQEEEEEQDRIKKLEFDRLQKEEYERMRIQREEKEAQEKEREAEAERARKEKAAAMEALRAEAAESHRLAAEAAAARKAAEPVVVPVESPAEEDGEWKKQGPAGRVPVVVASKTEEGAAAPWKASKAPSGGGGGLENAFGGNSAARRPTFGAGASGGEGSGWRGSRGNDAPAPVRSGSDWGGRSTESNRRSDPAPAPRNDRFAALQGSDRGGDRDRDNRGGGDRGGGDRGGDRDRDNRGGGDRGGGDRGGDRAEESGRWGNKSNDAPAPRRTEGSAPTEDTWRKK